MKYILGFFLNFLLPLKCYFAHLLSLKAHVEGFSCLDLKAGKKLFYSINNKGGFWGENPAYSKLKYVTFYFTMFLRLDVNYYRM